jgi:hypothetical protein
MTPEKIERNFEVCGLKLAKEATKLIVALCDYSAQQERERCAKIAEEIDCYGNLIEASRTIAVAIRKGEQP